MTTQTTTLPLDQLRIDDQANVRKTGRGADAHFVASIKALGVQMPLIVRKNGKGYVVADGGKRLEAAQALVKTGDLAADAPIPVIVTEISDAEARELSLALNLVRADMHPVDAFRAFNVLHMDKNKPLDVHAIATRFGIDVKTVRQRLALGALHDDILDAWRDEKIRQDAVQAFTLCPDKKEQARIFAKLSKNQHLSPWTVKEALKIGDRNVGPHLNLVGDAAYEARGGKITRDLFGSDHVVSDPALLRTMVDEKLAETCAALKADGWKWATSDIPDQRWEYRPLPVTSAPTQKEQKRLNKLREMCDDDSLNEDAMQKASDEYDALEAEIAKRAFSADQKAKAGCFVTLDSDGAINIQYGLQEPAKKTFDGSGITREERAKAAATKEKPVNRGLTQALIDTLNQARRSALKASLMQPSKDRLAGMLAGIVASQLHPESRYNWAPNEIVKREKELVDLIDPKIMNAALHKQFDAKDYFERCGKALCLAAITEAVNADEARKISDKKRAEIAKFATTNVKANWLPKELRTAHYDGPVKKAAAKKTTKKAR